MKQDEIDFIKNIKREQLEELKLVNCDDDWLVFNMVIEEYTIPNIGNFTDLVDALSKTSNKVISILESESKSLNRHLIRTNRDNIINKILKK